MKAELIDAIGVLAGLCGIIAFTPQILKILREKDTHAISARTYAVTTTGFALWVAYGAAQANWLLVGANGIMLAMAATIFALKLRYK